MKAIRIPLAAFCALVSFALMAEDLVIGNETVTFDSGERTFDSLKMGEGGNNYNSVLNLAGDSSTTIGPVSMSCNKNNVKSRLSVYGEATATLGKITCLASYTISNNRAYFSVSNEAEVSFGSITCGSANGTHYLDILFADSCHAVQQSGCTITSSHPTTYVTTVAKDNASVELQNIDVKKAGDQFQVKGHATVRLVKGDTVQSRRDAIDVSEDGTLILDGGTLQILANGGLTLRDRARGYVTSTGMLSLSRNSGPTSYLIISNQASFVSTNLINISRGYEYDTDRVDIYLCGGMLQFPGFQWGLYAPYKGAHCLQKLHCEGGTMKPMKDNADFIRYWQTAELVGAGLTLDTDGHATGVQQAFTGTTFTKAGAGTMTAKLDSDHETTAVAEGTLLLGSGVTTFGRTLVVTNGAMVSTEGAATGIAVETLRLGDADSAGIVVLDEGDAITVATASGLQAVNGKINYPKTDTDGTYDVIRVTSGMPTEDQLKGLAVYVKTLGKRYQFAAVEDGDGAKVQLTVSAATVREDVWTGAVSGAWRTGGNWDSGNPADELTIATFPASAMTKTVLIADAEEANSMILDDSYVFTGSGSLATGGIDMRTGESAVEVALKVSAEMAIANPAETRLDLSGDMEGSDAASVVKRGWGVMTVSGDNAAYEGAWSSDGGYLVFDGATAAGAAKENSAAWTLTGGTVTFTNGVQTIGRAMTIDPGATTAMVVNAECDTTVLGGIKALSGGLVKRGSGKLTLKYGQGTTTLTKDNFSRQGQMPTSGAITFPENGASPAPDNLSSLSVLSGTLRIEGVGQGSTTLSEQNRNHIVGGNWSEAPASARLELEKATLDMPGYDWQFVIGNGISSAAATRPTVSVGSGGYLSTTCTHVGREGSFEGLVYPVLAVTNGTAASGFDTWFGGSSASSKIRPIIRVGKGGSIIQRSANTRFFSYALHLGHAVDVEVADGGFLQTANTTWGLFVKPAASGEVRFLNGGKLEVPIIASQGAATTDEPLKIVFDGGIFAPTVVHTSSVHSAALRTIELRGAGLTYQSNVRHTLAMRVTGSGDFVKKGSGVLVFAKDNECLAHPGSSSTTMNNDTVTLGDSGFKTADFTGALRVETGSVVIEPGAARTGLKIDVAAGAAADFGGGTLAAYALSGAGTLRNAAGGSTVLMAADGIVPTLDGLTLDLVKVDFSSFGGALEKGDVLTVAKLANGSTVGRFKALNVTDKLTARFTVDPNGDVVATVGYKDGLVITVK